MPSPVARAEVIRENVVDHPAVAAWRRLGERRVPSEVRVLKERSKGLRKSAVYWLRGAGPGGAPVIAKLGKRRAVELERRMYDEVLPALPFATLRYYGALPGNAEFCWLFLEDAAGEPYRPELEAHRSAAGAWLGVLHAGAVSGDGSRLPGRGDKRFLEHLRSGRALLEDCPRRVRLHAEEASVVKRIVLRLERLEERWAEIEALSASRPPTLVHGDFQRKNLRVRPNGAALEIVAFDWEKAGWASPAVDLSHVADVRRRFSANPDLSAYQRALRGWGTPIGSETLADLVALGTVFRCLAAIDWASQGLKPSFVSGALATLSVYLEWLSDAMRALGWEDGSNA